MRNLLWPILLPPNKRLSTFFYQNNYEKYHNTRASSTVIILFIRNVEVNFIFLIQKKIIQNENKESD
jgi:hypothetical protein